MAACVESRKKIGNLQVSQFLYDVIEKQIAPGANLPAAHFWIALEELVAEMTPQNRALLARRDDLQAKIDSWHNERKGQSHDAAAYKRFLHDIGYIVEEGPDFTITTENVDPEIATIAGPQLVVPVSPMPGMP